MDQLFVYLLYGRKYKALEAGAGTQHHAFCETKTDTIIQAEMKWRVF